MSEPSPTLPGSPIGHGRYVCRALIGTGGMGEVYLADDTMSGQQVALKLIRADRANHVRALRRFTREVRAMARLDHPSIAAVYDYGVHTDGEVRRPWFVMERVQGASLRDFLNMQPSLDEALPIFDQVLAALAYAHARGVIHRDLKPENVLLATSVDGAPPVPKILDFGIARMVDDDNLDEATVARIELDMSESVGRGITDEMSTLEMGFLKASSASLHDAASSDDHGLDSDDALDADLGDEERQSTLDDAPPAVAARLTQINQCVGTPAYLAPEQIRARRHGVGPASDLYAVGIMLWELVCGQRPFRARTPRELLRMHLAQPVPPLEPLAGRTVPEGLAALIGALLSKSPHDRPAFAADVRRVLRAIMTGRDRLPGVASVRETAPEGLSTLAAAVGPSAAATFEREPLPGDALRDPNDSLFPGERTGRRRGLGTAPSSARLALGLVQFREPRFVGRSAERQALWQRFSQVHERGTMQLVLVEGEAGVGKTRLVRWLRERAEELGLARAALAPCSAGPGGAGLRVALERHLVCKGLEDEALRERVREELRRLELTEPWIENALVSFLRPSRNDGTLVAAVPVRGTTLAMGDAILRRLTRDRPLIFQIDDVQEASDEALELIEFLLGQQGTAPYPALVVACVRSEAILTRATLRARLARLCQHPAVSRLALDPLDRAEIVRLVDSLLPLDRATSAILADRAGGHPQFAVQLLHHWAEAHELEPSPDGLVLRRTHDAPVPSRINEVAERRVAKFLESLARRGHAAHVAQSVLAWMAIVGEPVDFAVLQEVCASESLSAEQVDTVWEAALVDGLCLEDPHDESLRFGHGVVRAQLLEWARSQEGYAERQARCAEAKLRLQGQDPVQLNYEVASHLFEAGDTARAWRHLVFSARCSLDLSQFQLAHERLRRALDLAAGAAAPLGPVQGQQRRVARPRSVMDLDPGERFEARRAWLEACLRLNLVDDLESELALLASDAGDHPMRLGWAALLEASVSARRGEVERAIELYHLALERFGSSDPDSEGVARALCGLGDTLARSGRIPAGLEALRRAEPIARRSGSDNLLAEVLLSAGASHFDDGDHLASERCLSEALRLFESTSNLAGAGETHFQLGRAHLLLGNLAAARAHFDAARRAHTHIGDRHGIVRALNGYGEVARQHGELAEAETAYLQALELLEESGADAHESLAIVRANLGLVLLERGQHESARRSLVVAARMFRRLGTRPTEVIVCGLLAATEAAVGNFAGCRGWLDCIEQAGIDRPPADRDYAEHLLSASRVAARAGEAALVASLLQHAHASYALLGDVDQLTRIEGMLRELEASGVPR